MLQHRRMVLSDKNASHILIDTWDFLACLRKTLWIYPSVKNTRNKTFDLFYFLRCLRYTLYFISVTSLYEVSVLLRHDYIPEEQYPARNETSLCILVTVLNVFVSDTSGLMFKRIKLLWTLKLKWNYLKILSRKLIVWKRPFTIQQSQGHVFSSELMVVCSV